MGFLMGRTVYRYWVIADMLVVVDSRQGLFCPKTGVVRSYELLVNLCQITLYHIPEDSIL